LALGAALRAGIEPPLPPGITPDQRVVEGRRDVIAGSGKWTYLYRGVDSAGYTIDFLLSARRDVAAAKRFFQKALRSPGHPRPRVINVDGNPSYPKVITELKKNAELGRRCRSRPVRYLNNIVEQDHRALKRRVRASQGFRSFQSARRTIQGIETMNLIRKEQIRWLAKGDIAGQVAFVLGLLGLATAA
jgi:transposase, IS6 family